MFGFAIIVPFYPKIIAIAMAFPVVTPLAAGAVDTHAVPFEDKTFPAVPGDVKPVPPFAGATTPVTLSAVPVVF